jgi:hypothetical protein
MKNYSLGARKMCQVPSGMKAHRTIISSLMALKMYYFP